MPQAQPWWEDHMPDQSYIQQLIQQQIQQQQMNPGASSPVAPPTNYVQMNTQAQPSSFTKDYPDPWGLAGANGTSDPNFPSGVPTLPWFPTFQGHKVGVNPGANGQGPNYGDINNPPPPVEPQIQGGHNFEPNSPNVGGPVPPGAALNSGNGWDLLQGGQVGPAPIFPAVLPDTAQQVTQQQSVGQIMNEPRAPASAMAGPPRTPQEEQQRIGAWQSFYEKAKMNPNVWLALIKFGTEMMQPTQPNQTHLGHFGRSLQGSLDFYSTLNQNDREQQQKAEEHASNLKYREAQTNQAEASSTNLRASAEHTSAETEDLIGLRGLKKDEMLAKIKQMQKSLDLTDEQIKNYQTELQRNPKYQEAIIRELNARAKYYSEGGSKNGAGGGMGATYNNTQALADALLQTEPDLMEMAKTNPQAAKSAAWVRATERSKAVGIQHNYGKQNADQQYQYYLDEYNSLKAANSPKIKGKTFQQWAQDEIEFSTSMDMQTKTALRNKIVQPQSTGPAPQNQTPSGAGGQPTKKTFGYDQNGKLIVK